MNVINSYRFKDSLSRSYLITTWKTDNVGDTNSTSISIPVKSGETYNYEVNWDLDNSDVWESFTTDTPPIHNYGVAGVYKVAIRGIFPSIYFFQYLDNDKILSIEQWGSIAWNSLDYAFYYCSNLVINATDTPDLSNIHSLQQMFYSATSIVGLGADWDVSNITNMELVFGNASSFNHNIGNWDVSNVTHMNGMFFNASSFDQNLENWDVSNVIDMNSIFNLTSLSTQNYDALLIAWSELPLQQNVTFGAGNSKYSAGAAATARQKIIDDFNWIITDGGQV